jgi:hypothetical protein
MNWPVSIGWIVFLAVPLALWLIGSLANRGHGFAAAALTYIAGSDNRLSISRLQAFLWTLIIFGAWFAAMAIHTSIPPEGKWIQIPSALLALAGISIGSGVVSSLIAAVHSDQQSARVTSLSTAANNAGFTAAFPNASPPENPYALVITGTDLGDSGRVRLGRLGLGKRRARVLFWNSNGTQILVDLAGNQSYDKLVIETKNGKLTYTLRGVSPDLTLGVERVNYELADLFRDDKNPETFSLMKFQMFGWTVVAIFIFVYLFLAHLTRDITTLPTVDPSIAVLTGVSQAGYLAGKGVSNVQPNG